MQESLTPTPLGPVAAPLPHQLVEHWEWTRALARRIVSDPHDADDAAQDAWLLAQGAEAGGGSGARAGGRAVHAGFFGTILRNLTRAEARARRNREARQGEVVRRRAIHGDGAQGEEAMAPDEVAAAAETGRELCAAVLELPDLYRDVILQRYFQGLTNGEIALRGQVSEGTTRSRLKRALDRLRERFDGAKRTGRQLPLACFAGAVPAGWLRSRHGAPGATTTGSRVVGWGAAQWGAFMGAAVALGLMLFGFRLLPGAPATSPAVQAMLPWSAGGASSFELSVDEVAVNGRVQAGEGAVARKDSSLLFEVKGRIMDVDRKPLAGVQLRLQCRGAKGGPVDLVTGHDGAFRLSSGFRPGGSGHLKVDAGSLLAARVFRFGSTGVGVNRPPSAGLRDLGDVVLGPRGQITARLVDSEGDGLTRVELWMEPLGSGPGEFKITDAQGYFGFQGLRTGVYVIRAEDARYKQGQIAEVRVQAGNVAALQDVLMTERITAPGEGPEGLVILDHNEAEADGEREPVPGPIFTGQVLRSGRPVAGLDVTASLLIGRDRDMKIVPLATLPVERWLERLETLESQRPPVIRAETDAEGRFVLRGVIPGVPYRVVAWGEDDHSVLQPAVAEITADEAALTQEEEPGDLATPLGALELVPYARVLLRVRGAESIDGYEYELRRKELDAYHVVGADRAGAFVMERVCSGPQMLWLDSIAGRFARGCSVKLNPQPGESLTLEVDASAFALAQVRVKVLDQAGPSSGFTVRFAGRAGVGGKAPELRAYAGAWQARGFVRVAPGMDLEIEIDGRRIRRPWPEGVAGDPMEVGVRLDGGAELRLELPESVEFLGQGLLEFEGPRTSWSVQIRDGEPVELPWGVLGAAPSQIVVRALNPGAGEYRVRVTDTEPGPGDVPGDGARVLFEKERRLVLSRETGAVWSLR